MLGKKQHHYYQEVAYSHWLHLFDFSPLRVFKCLDKMSALAGGKATPLRLTQKLQIMTKSLEMTNTFAAKFSQSLVQRD